MSKFNGDFKAAATFVPPSNGAIIGLNCGPIRRPAPRPRR